MGERLWAEEKSSSISVHVRARMARMAKLLLLWALLLVAWHLEECSGASSEEESFARPSAEALVANSPHTFGDAALSSSSNAQQPATQAQVEAGNQKDEAAKGARALKG